MMTLASSTMKGMDLSDSVNRDLIGTPEEVLERINQYREAGVTSFPAILFTANNMSEFFDEMQWFAEDVVKKTKIDTQ